MAASGGEDQSLGWQNLFNPPTPLGDLQAEKGPESLDCPFGAVGGWRVRLGFQEEDQLPSKGREAEGLSAQVTSQSPPPRGPEHPCHLAARPVSIGRLRTHL